ncbi:3-deoxy-D-manno-octulosonic acid transferase, partial [Bordetella bronchiseptica]
MGRGVYTLALRGLAPLIWLWMWRRARRAGGQWELFAPARFGRAGAR